ncbi:MAG TPA: hypothetical protein PKE06_07465, partial [Flavilitoribacter sp.]|nr:hypothetical protein [Flavilitoribacter sp.]
NKVCFTQRRKFRIFITLRVLKIGLTQNSGQSPRVGIPVQLSTLGPQPLGLFNLSALSFNLETADLTARAAVIKLKHSSIPTAN